MAKQLVKLKRNFVNFSPQVPHEIATVEEELIKEGIPVEQIRKLCDVHLAAFQDALEKTQLDLPQGHPIKILMDEHNQLLKFANDLQQLSQRIKTKKSFKDASKALGQLETLLKKFQDSENHYLREENVLFPVLEKHGITQPPAIMWMEHDQIREIKKNLYKVVNTRESTAFDKFTAELDGLALALAEMLAGHFQKENNILFPTGLKVITPVEWNAIRNEFNEIGFPSFSPKPPEFMSTEVKSEGPTGAVVGQIAFETGSFQLEELEALLDALPVDITFVGNDDTVRFFNQPEDRFFVRTKAVLGREVQACHPKKSLHIVQKIIDEFKKGSRDKAEFWIRLKGRVLLIRYFPVRTKAKGFLGVLEVTQDITEIQKITGEKRLLD